MQTLTSHHSPSLPNAKCHSLSSNRTGPHSPPTINSPHFSPPSFLPPSSSPSSTKQISPSHLSLPIMSDQDPNRRPPSSHGPPISQPYQYIDSSDGHKFTPYYKTPAEAAQSPGTWTPHLHNGLSEPPKEWPVPRNQFPKSDPIMDARREV